MQSEPAALSILEVQTRFIYPFLYPLGRAGQAADALLTLLYKGRHLWEDAEPHELYRQELLGHVSDTLFPEAGNGCRYFRVSDVLVNAWFRHGTRMEEIRRNKGEVKERTPVGVIV